MTKHLGKNFKSFWKKPYPVTNLILGITVVHFLVLQILRLGSATSARAIYDFGGLLGLAIQLDTSQVWRLLTAMFVHIGWEHIVLNGIAIYFLGRQFEALFGSVKFTIFYFLSGFMGNIFVLFFTPDVVTAGASTAIFGLFSALVVLRFFVNNPYIRSLGQNYLILLLLNLAMGFLSPNISMAGHIGGAVGGALCAVFLPLKGEERAFSQWQRGLALFVYIFLVVVLFLLRLS